MSNIKLTIIGLQNYSDKNNNKINYSGITNNTRVTFHGKNNTILVANKFNSKALTIELYGDNNLLALDNCNFRGFLRLGGGAKINIGDNVTCTENCFIAASEGTT